MKRIYSSICAAGILSLIANVCGQQNPAGILPGRPGFAPGPGAPYGVPAAPRQEPIRMDIDFPGGAPEKLLQLMKEAAEKSDVRGAKPNVILHPEAIHTDIPRFSLRGVTASQVFGALNMLADPGESASWQVFSSEDGEIWTLMPVRRPAAIDPLTGLPVGHKPQGGFRPPGPMRECRVFNLTPVLDDYTIEDVTTAVKGAWELMATGGENSLKYHKDTKLLIALADPSELAIVNQVIQELTQNVRLKKAGGAKGSEPARPDSPPKDASPKKS